MMMLLRIAFLSLWQHRRRTGVLMVCIGLVTALMVMMLGIGEAMNRSLVETSTTLMSGHVNVGGFYKVTNQRTGSNWTEADSSHSCGGA